MRFKKMKELYFIYFCRCMSYTKGFISKWRKGELRIFRYEDVKVAVLNDYDNRRVLVWYYYEPTGRIMKISYHGYYVKYLANKIAYTVKLIQTDDNYREIKLFERRSYSYKAERKFRSGR